MTTHNPEQQYQIFQQHRQELLGLIDQQAQVLQRLEMSGRLESIRNLEQRVKEDTFKVMVMGEFNVGKSTFINALLHKEVLPSYGVPCTALINKVKWGDQPQAVLHYQRSEDGSVRSPLQIPVEKLEEYVVIKEFSNNNPQALDSPYESVDLFWPLDLCRNKVEIIDSPGLNENPFRQRITLNYLRNVDAVLFVLSCSRLGPADSEQNAIDMIRSEGHEDIFFICNYFDVIRRREQERIRQHGLSQFGGLTKRGAAGVFFISALDALEGRLEDDAQLVQQSGVPPLENALATFLTQDRGRLKIQNSATRLKDNIHEARRTILQKKSLLQKDLHTLDQKFAEAQKTLQTLDKQCQQIVTHIKQSNQHIEEHVSLKVDSFYSKLIAKVPKWIEEYPFQSSVSIFQPNESNPAIEMMFTEVYDDVTEKIKSEFASFQSDELEPFIYTHLVENIKNNLEPKVRQFFRQVDELRRKLTGDAEEADEIKELISPLNEIIFDAGEWSMGSVGPQWNGLGWKEFIRSLLSQTFVFGGITLISNPFAMAGFAIASVIAESWIKKNIIHRKIKEVASEKIIKHLNSTKSEKAVEIAESVMKPFEVIQKAVDKGLHKKMQEVQDLVESSLAERRKGQAYVDQKVAELQTLGNKIDHIHEKLDELVNKV